MKADSSKLYRALSILLLGLFLGAAGWYFLRNREALADIGGVHWGYAALIMGCFALNMLFRGMLNKRMLQVFDIPLGLVESTALTSSATMLNFILPLRSGAGFRAVYLKKRHSFPIRRFASMLLALYIIVLFGSTGIGLAASLFIAARGGPASLGVSGLLAGVFAVTGWMIFLAPAIPEGRGRLGAFLGKISRGWELMRRDRNFLIQALILEAAFNVAAAVGFWAGFKAFAFPISAEGSILFTSAQNLGGLIGLTPGSMGFQELIGLYFGRVLTATTFQTLTAFAAVRLLRVAASILLGLPSLAILTRRPVALAAEDPEKK